MDLILEGVGFGWELWVVLGMVSWVMEVELD